MGLNLGPWQQLSEALESEASRRETVGLGGRVPRLGVGHGYAEALRPLLRVLTVFGLENQRLVAGEYLERLGDVARASRHFH